MIEPVTAPERPSGFLPLDNLALENMAQGYPEELQERVVWLGCFLREECRRSMDALVDRAAKLDISLDKTNWSKILRGRWNRDAEGKTLDTPIVNLKKLCGWIDTLRADARIKAQGGKVPFVMTGTAIEICNYIDALRAPDRVNKWGVIVGETGLQKSATFKDYTIRNNHGTVVHLEAPENGSLKEFIGHLAFRYGRTLNYSYEAKRNHIFDTVNERKCIIVDNAQDLYKAKFLDKQPALGFLRRLQDERGCTIVLSVTQEGEKLFFKSGSKDYLEQFEGRAGGRRNFLRLSPQVPEDDILQIAEAFKLRDAERHIKYLVNIAREPGRIRRLFEDLQKAKIRAEDRKETFTLSHIKWARDED